MRTKQEDMCTGLPELTPVDFYEDEAGTIGLKVAIKR